MLCNKRTEAVEAMQSSVWKEPFFLIFAFMFFPIAATEFEVSYGAQRPELIKLNVLAFFFKK
jgi:hypothetical protein